MRRHSPLYLATLAVLSLPAQAKPLRDSLSLDAYTGLLLSPNAEVTEYGTLQAGFSNPAEKKGSYRDAYNYVASFGLLPGLEATGRIAAFDNSCNGYTQKNSNCHRDLSASAKYQLPFIPADWFDAAIGARDIGGEANNFAAYYGVVSRQWWQVRLSAGAGQSKSKLGQLNGPFGGVEWQALDWLQLLAEYDASSWNLGTRLYSPNDWLPAGWQLSTSLLAKQTQTHSERDWWWGIGLKIPLATGTPNSRYSARGFASDDAEIGQPAAASSSNAPSVALASQPAASLSVIQAPAAPPSPAPAQPPGAAKSDTEQHLYQQLVDAGFENIRVGHHGDVLVVALENNRYNWNELDGLGVALGLVANEAAPRELTRFRLVLLNQQLPVLTVAGTSRCTRAYLAGQPDCAGADLAFSNRQLADSLQGVTWSAQGQSGALVPRVVVAPAIRSAVATEYGTLDYSLALSTNLQLPLWPGAMADVRHFAPLDHSDDYADGKVFGKDRYHSDVDRILLHQAFWLPGDLFTKFSAGRIMSDYQGLQNETRWETAEGRHRFTLESAYFRQTDSKQTAEPVLGTYRYARPDWSWSADLTAGRFWQDDTGFKFVSHHWFGDTEVRLFYRNSNEQIAGIEIALPLTLRQDMRPRYLQVRGSEQFAYGVETLLNRSHNYLTPGVAITPSLTHNVDQVYFNRDRLNPAYIRANLSRLRDAWQHYGQ